MPAGTLKQFEEQKRSGGERTWYQREFIVLMWLAALTVVLFLVAYFVTSAFRRQQTGLGSGYFKRGEAALDAAQPEQAITDFRAALVYAPEDREYRLRLAQALALAHHDKEAFTHFKDLWEGEPGDGELNLELARLAAHSGDMSEALRFFHGAIYGLWSQNPAENRHKAWLELIRFLLREHANTQAQSELLALSATIPTDAGANADVASLFMQSGDEGHAFQFYRKALRLDRKNTAALIGAGQASFALGNYKDAVEYFKTASTQQALPPDVQSQAETAELVLRLNPYQRGLSSPERRSRALAAFSQAGDRLKECAVSKGQQLAPAAGQNPSPLQADYSQWNTLQQGVNPKAMRANPDLIDSAMDLVYRIEQDTQEVCGEPTGKDRALLLLARQGSGSGR